MRFAPVSMLVWWGLCAQTASAPLSFEVASIKPSAPDAPGMFVQPQPGGGLRVTGATVKNLIAIAYNVREFVVSGGPAWIGSDRFDIEARTEHSAAPTNQRQVIVEIRTRLRSLLAVRFQMAVHNETKEQNVYALVLAKNGPKFHEATPESGSLIRGRQGTITGQGTGMQMLALNLSNQLGRPVLDKTGLTGKYDFKLEWTPDAGLTPSSQPATVPELGGPSLFAALQEQLGLLLETQKGKVEMLVIDRVEKPSEN